MRSDSGKGWFTCRVISFDKETNEVLIRRDEEQTIPWDEFCTYKPQYQCQIIDVWRWTVPVHVFVTLTSGPHDCMVSRELFHRLSPVYRAYCASEMKDLDPSTFSVTAQTELSLADLQLFAHMCDAKLKTLDNETNLAALFQSWTYCQMDPLIFITELKADRLKALSFEQVAALYVAIVDAGACQPFYMKYYLGELAQLQTNANFRGRTLL